MTRDDTTDMLLGPIRPMPVLLIDVKTAEAEGDLPAIA